MLSTSNPVSSFGRPSNISTARQTKRPTTKDGEKQAIWVPMLNSASKGKDLAEKQLLVLGGSPDQQREFLQQLNPETNRPRYANERHNKKPIPISNRYALGYTYQDVLDADQEDILARLNVYMLSNPSAAFAPLLHPLLSTKTVKDTLIVILLDWSDPFKWARQLRQWIRLLRSVIITLDDETKIAMEENMTAWKERKVGPDAAASQPGGNSEQNQTSTGPLGPGEWDEGLGIPLAVVCIESEKIEMLERDIGWHDEQFDFLVQWLRCVLLKHGASLVYTASFDANDIRTLTHSSLGIRSLLKKDIVKPNYLDRDKTLIPSNWDSWGKIRVLREATDLEAISDAWSVEIQRPAEENPDYTTMTSSTHSEESAVSIYETTLPDPRKQRLSNSAQTSDELVTTPSIQEFLQSQQPILEKFKAEDENNDHRSGKDTGPSHMPDLDGTKLNPRVAEQIGPYQINVNGIDFDVEEATRRLRERGENEKAAISTVKSETRGSSGITTPIRRGPLTPGVEGDGANKTRNEEMASFFQSLIHKKDKKATGSGTGTGPGSGAVSPSRANPSSGEK